MDLQSIIENYGYAAILIGTFLEGETILVLAGLAAHQGYLALTWVILAAFLGSLSGDQLFFIWDANTVKRFCPGALPGRGKRKKSTS
jgi:membrane protein DedA with SNARE-associated domain